MIGFLIKGLFRDHTRSFFPILMVSSGVFLTVFLYSWMQGVITDMVSTNARFDTGHVKIMTRAYNELADENPNDLALLKIGELLALLNTKYKDMIWTPRICFGGILDIPDKKGETRIQGPVVGFGINLISQGTPENEILGLNNALIKGRMPEARNEILISDLFAKRLGVGIGDTVTLISSTMYGSMAMYNFKIAGTIRFGVTSMDREAIFADISALQETLDMDDGSSVILGFRKNMVYSDKDMKKMAQEFNASFSKEKDRFSPFMICLSDQHGLSDLLKQSYMIGGIIVSVFVIIMSIVLWNSGLMNNIRRYGETGLRIAMGESKGAIYRRMLMESCFIGITGSLLGTILGLALSWYLQNKGLDVSQMFQKSPMLISNKLRASVTPVSFYIGFLPGLMAPVLGSMAAGIGIYKRQCAQLFRELEN